MNKFKHRKLKGVCGEDVYVRPMGIQHFSHIVQNAEDLCCLCLTSWKVNVRATADEILGLLKDD